MLENEINDYAIANGATITGFSCLGDIWEDISRTWPVADITTRNAVTVGIALNSSIVDEILAPREDTYERYYRDCYTVVNDQLNELTAMIVVFLQDKGYKSRAILASDRVGTDGLLGTLSHKIAARRAGLGWIGRHCMIVTPQYGPAIRWGTIFTDAVFAPVKIMDNGCGNCRACVEICPVKAYTGKPFAENDPLSERYDTVKCRDYIANKKCSKCLAICRRIKGETPGTQIS